MKSFSVLTVSRRKGWEQIAVQSLKRQTAQPDKWIIVTENSLNIPADAATLITAPKKKRASNLNASLNVGLKLIKTDYVIFYQDFIELAPDCFEKLLYLATKNTFVTTCTPNYDGSNDSRYQGLDYAHPCRPKEWEANVAIAPMPIIRELGGFDEEYDDGWAWDNVNLAERAEMLGCRFIIDEANRPKLFPHDSEGLQPNGDLHGLNMQKIKMGEKPLRLHYL